MGTPGPTAPWCACQEGELGKRSFTSRHIPSYHPTTTASFYGWEVLLGQVLSSATWVFQAPDATPRNRQRAKWAARIQIGTVPLHAGLICSLIQPVGSATVI
ncbi:hypothetical protein BDP81DRAFT_416178, partial [Colletotrichum phormii]